MIFEAAINLFTGYDFELTEKGEFYFINQETKEKRLATEEEITLINAEIPKLIVSIEKKESAESLKSEIRELDQQCIRPLLEIHYLQRQGKDTAQEDAFLNQRYAQILIKRAELQALESNA